MQSRAQRRQYGDPVEAAVSEYSLRAKAHPRTRTRVGDRPTIGIAYSSSAGACPARIFSASPRSPRKRNGVPIKGVAAAGHRRSALRASLWRPPLNASNVGHTPGPQWWEGPRETLRVAGPEGQWHTGRHGDTGDRRRASHARRATRAPRQAVGFTGSRSRSSPAF
jgi:hypothetical protein